MRNDVSVTVMKKAKKDVGRNGKEKEKAPMVMHVDEQSPVNVVRRKLEYGWVSS